MDEGIAKRIAKISEDEYELIKECVCYIIDSCITEEDGYTEDVKEKIKSLLIIVLAADMKSCIASERSKNESTTYRQKKFTESIWWRLLSSIDKSGKICGKILDNCTENVSIFCFGAFKTYNEIRGCDCNIPYGISKFL